MQTISVGKGSDNQIVIEDNFVSRHHAQLIIHDNGQITIKDLGSSNGTFVNGVRITESNLNTGDIVKCGPVLLNWMRYTSDVYQTVQQNAEPPSSTVQSLYPLLLLPNETAILTSSGDGIILTSQRIHLTEKNWGRSHSITIFLENISSIQLFYKSNLLLLILGILGLLAFPYFLATDNFDLSWPSLVTGLILILMWFLSRKHLVSIYPDGGKPLEFIVGKMPGFQIENFINTVQLAKAERINELFSIAK